MNESLRRSLSRASARGPYSLGASPAAPGLPGSPASSMEDASEVIRRAKQDLERLKKKEVRQRRKRRVSTLGSHRRPPGGARCPGSPGGSEQTGLPLGQSHLLLLSTQERGGSPSGSLWAEGGGREGQPDSAEQEPGPVL